MNKAQEFIEAVSGGISLLEKQLDKVTNSTRQKAIKFFTEDKIAEVERFAKWYGTWLEGGEEPAMILPKDKRDTYQNLSKFFTRKKRFSPDTEYGLKDGYKELVKKEMTGFVNRNWQTYRSKNLSKLQNIINGKNNLKKVELVSSGFSSGVLESSMNFIFTDGSSFNVVNKVVFATSRWGKFFAKFPTTFHNVKLSDGSKI